MIPTKTVFEVQLSFLEEGPMINGKSDKTAMAKKPIIFATDSNRAIELITFEVFNFFRIYIILVKLTIRTDTQRTMKSTIDVSEK